MYCSNCGSEIHDEAVICIHCGVATQKQQQLNKRESNPLAIMGFVMSFFVMIAGLVSSIIAYCRCKENPRLAHKGLSLAGIIISSVKLGIAAMYLMLFLVLSAL